MRTVPGAALADLPRRAVELVEPRPAALDLAQEGLALGRQGDAAVPAREQRETDLGFEPRDRGVTNGWPMQSAAAARVMPLCRTTSRNRSRARRFMVMPVLHRNDYCCH